MYVDAIHDRDENLIRVVERLRNGQRVYRNFPVKHVFYYEDPKGKYKSIYGTPLSRVSCKSQKELRKELAIHSNKVLHESDVNPVFRCLSDEYANAELPKLQVAFFDIETDMQPYAVPSSVPVSVRDKITGEIKNMIVFQLGQLADKNRFEVLDTNTDKWVPVAKSRYLEPGPGYASPEDPFLPITSIAVHLQWLDTLVCLAIPPKTITMEQAQEMVSEFPNTYLFEKESDMLNTFLDLIQDADIISAWNGEVFDIPYCVNRVTRVLGKDATRRFCLWNMFPKKREYEKFGKTATTYDLIGRLHLDMLEVYRKYTYEERHSYSLDAISEIELGDHKTVYDGTLDQLYHNDFRKFIDYNRQDTLLVCRIDEKLKYIDLLNTISHANTVPLQTAMGSVALIEQGIINEAHDRGLIVPNRKEHPGDTQAVGAYVAYPRKGLHDWIGSLDINSLYPSTIRALNMCVETIVGQLRPEATDALIKERIAAGKSFAEAWEGMFSTLEYQWVMDQDHTRPIVIDWEHGGCDTLTGSQIYELIFNSNQPWMISANGTIFKYDVEGVVPGLLKRWYSERKAMQKELKISLDLRDGIELPAELLEKLS